MYLLVSGDGLFSRERLFTEVARERVVSMMRAHVRRNSLKTKSHDVVTRANGRAAERKYLCRTRLPVLMELVFCICDVKDRPRWETTAHWRLSSSVSLATTLVHSNQGKFCVK